MANIDQEIIRFHEFFVAWMTGTLAKTDDNFAQFADSLSDDFYIIPPAGQYTPRDTLVTRLYDTHNQRRNFRIWIENVKIHHTVGDVIVATYEEWQENQDDNKIVALISTAVFVVDQSKPNGLRWQCVHETWLQK